ncbi:MAG: hypothetical protein V8S42_03325 [Lachnospiraceae bacterium]
MKKNTVESLIRELNQEGKGLIIILEDKKEAIEKFLTKYPALATIFNLRVDVEALDDQTLVKYARSTPWSRNMRLMSWVFWHCIRELQICRPVTMR